MGISDAWRQAIDDYLGVLTAAGAPKTTRGTRRQHLEHMARRVGEGPWALTPDDVVDYAETQDWASETRRGRRATFVGFWAWAMETGRADVDASSGLRAIRPSDPDPRPVPDDVYLAALARADELEALWIDLAAEHGLRRAEIARIASSDIVPTLLGHDLRVQGKGKKIRVVPLTPAMARALLERSAALGGGWLWPGDDDGHVSPRWLGKRVTRLLDGAWTIHKLRHRAATRFWLASDGDAYLVADLMGWANLNMVRRYVALPSDRKRAIVLAASRSGASIAA